MKDVYFLSVPKQSLTNSIPNKRIGFRKLVLQVWKKKIISKFVWKESKITPSFIKMMTTSDCLQTFTFHKETFSSTHFTVRSCYISDIYQK